MTGDVFGPYRVQELLGRGGMGEVHRAVDTRKGRVVALKRLSSTSGDAQARERFVREAETASRLHEPHVIPIHDYGEIDGQLFLDMRLVEGRDLSVELAHRGALPAARAVDVVTQAAGALDAAHRAGLIHRDVKPANMLLSGAHGVDHVYLVDFGIAHAVNRTHLTSTGVAIGTFAYMAPERFAGTDADHRSDVYALGCVLHEALTGEQPFPVRDPAQLMWAHSQLEPPRPSRVRASVPRGLDAVVSRALAKDPSARFDHAGALASAAREVLARELRPVPAPTRVAGPVARRPVPQTLHAEASPDPDPASRHGIVAIALLGLALVATVALLGVTAFVEPGFLVKPGSPDDTAAASVRALNTKNGAELGGLACVRLDGEPAAAFPPDLLALVGGARQGGAAVRTLDTEARVPVELTLTQDGKSQTLPSDLLLGVTDGHWCLNGISQRQ